MPVLLLIGLAAAFWQGIDIGFSKPADGLEKAEVLGGEGQDLVGAVFQGF